MAVVTDNGAGSNSGGGALSPNQVRAIAYQAGFRGAGLDTAVKIAGAESGRIPTNRYAPGPQEDSRGLWQINIAPSANPGYASQNLYDPLTNAKIAFAMSHGGTNWGPWTTYTSGRYLSQPSGGGSSSMPSGASGSASNATSAPGTGIDQGAFQKAQAANVAGNYLRGAKSPFDMGQPKTGLEGGKNLLIGPGLLTAGAAPKASDFATAQSALQKLAGGSAMVQPHPSLVGTSVPSGNGGGFLPQGAKYIVGRHDQGRDGTTNPGGPIIAPGNGTVIRVGSDPGGFGPNYPIVHFTSGPYAGRDIYIGHTHAAITSGSFKAGQVLSYTGTNGVGNATVPGWFEIGFANGGSPGAFGQPTPF